MPERHRLLARQLRQHFGEELPPDVQAFADAVDRSYNEFDADRRLLERSLELSSSELLQANADLRALFESFPDLFFRIDESGTILDYKAGRSAELVTPGGALIGRKIQEAPLEAVRAAFSAALQKVKRTQAVVQIEYQMPRNGVEHHYEARLVPLDEKSIVVVVRNIDDRKALQIQLLQSQKMETIGTLAGGVAHDINNQLTPLIGSLDLILAQTPPEHPQRALVLEAYQSALRCAEVVQRLLAFSRTSSQKKRPVSVASLVRDIKRLIVKLLPATITVEISCPDSCPYLMANATELETMFLNLAANARDAMPEGGSLAVNVAAEPSSSPDAEAPDVVFRVSDSGHGMSEETLRRAFEPFFTTKRPGEGTGLGLAMAFNIVRDHGGSIGASSLPGRGTTFEIRLPGRLGEAASETATPSPQRLPGGRETILLADDEEPIRNFGRKLLEHLGYKVLLAANGEEMLDAYRESPGRIAAVIMDMTMPKLTGREALRRLLELDPSARVIASSGHTHEGSPEELVAAGARSFVAKPYSAMELATALRRCLDEGRS